MQITISSNHAFCLSCGTELDIRSVLTACTAEAIALLGSKDRLAFRMTTRGTGDSRHVIATVLLRPSPGVSRLRAMCFVLYAVDVPDDLCRSDRSVLNIWEELARIAPLPLMLRDDLSTSSRQEEDEPGGLIPHFIRANSDSRQYIRLKPDLLPVVVQACAEARRSLFERLSESDGGILAAVELLTTADIASLPGYVGRHAMDPECDGMGLCATARLVKEEKGICIGHVVGFLPMGELASWREMPEDELADWEKQESGEWIVAVAAELGWPQD